MFSKERGSRKKEMEDHVPHVPHVHASPAVAEVELRLGWIRQLVRGSVAGVNRQLDFGVDGQAFAFVSKFPVPVRAASIANEHVAALTHAVVELAAVSAVVQPLNKFIVSLPSDHVERDSVGADDLLVIGWIRLAELVDSVS